MDTVNKPSLSRIISGISDFEKESVLPNSVAWLRSVDFRSDPRKITALPKTTKESGNTYQALPKWYTQRSTVGYIYDSSGNLYQRTAAGSHTLIRSVGNSNGNGLAYYGEDDFVYYTTDTTIGRYGQFSAGSPTFTDDFLSSEGGVPTNTGSIELNGSTQYLTHADAAELSITGDLAMEIYFNLDTLPTVGNSVVLLSKWNENSNQRSYKLDIYAISGVFGSGSGGAYTVSTDTTQSPTDSACSGTIDTKSLSATNASFAAGQTILIHQSRGTNAGTWQVTKIDSYTAGTITTEDNLIISYSSTGSNKAQVIVIPEYSSITVNSGVTWSAKAWTGSVGGILVYKCSGTVTVTGTISATGKGFQGSGSTFSNTYGNTGEGDVGAAVTNQRSRNGNGGGGAAQGATYTGGGGGGGNGLAGSNGNTGTGGVLGGQGGTTSGSTDLTLFTFGGGGGGASNSGDQNIGGTGAGGIFGFSVDLSVTGSMVANGNDGDDASGTAVGAGGAGAGGGGSILLNVQTGTLGTDLLSAAGGTGGTGYSGGGNGGNGGVGRIYINYLTSITGSSSTPSFGSTQDNTLVTDTSYQLRFQISNDGTAVETYAKVIDISTEEWNHASISFDASESEGTLGFNGASLGAITGSMTAIYDSTADYAAGASFDSSGTAENFLDGKIDEDRLWNTIRTISQVYANKDSELVGNEPGLVAYHPFDGSLSDATSNAFDWTNNGSAAYSSETPFSSPTTRLDIDQEDTSSGNTYNLTTAIDEGASHRQTFTPSKDPQKSISINISAKGTNCDWTLTVHDALNRVVATVTVLNAELPTSGFYEFIFDSPWRPVLDANYHFHLTATNTTGTPAVVTGTASSLETAQFKSYYQFLVTDTQWHPLKHYLNLLAISNERYLAVWDGASYNPHRLKFPSGYRVRAFGDWNGFIAIGCMFGDSIGTRDQGKIFFWDGYSDTYNDAIDVPQGAINAMIGSVGELHFVAGYKGDYMIYSGGSKARKIKRIPRLAKGEEVEVYPGAMTMWEALLRIGVAGSSDSETVEKGVYTYGSINEMYNDSFSYDYPISTGNRLSTVQVGMTAAVGKKLLIGWTDGLSSGVDVVDPAGDAFASARIELLIDDQGGVWKEKILSMLRADVNPMIDGQSVKLEYKIDRGEWVTLTNEENDDRSVVKTNINGGRHREYQLAIELNTTVSTAPSLLALTSDENVNADEERG